MQTVRNTNAKTADWQKLLPFRKIFERKSFSAGKWVDRKGQLPFYTYSDSVSRFIQTVYDAGIVEQFDWPKWQTKAERLVLDPKAIESASLGTLRKLLTTHVRKDRFCEGHLAAMFENGHILAILRRVVTLLHKPKR